MKLTYEQSLRLANRLVGTADEIQTALEAMDLSPDDYQIDEIEQTLSQEHSVERCQGCDWWCDTCELVDEDNEVVGCDQCR